MKNVLLGSAMLLSSSIATAEDAFEIISMKFKDEVSFEEQKQAMSTLNSIVTTFEGFKARDYFYSEENQRWIDFIVWTDLSLAKKASTIVMNNPTATAVFALMEEESMIFSYYRKTKSSDIETN